MTSEESASIEELQAKRQWLRQDTVILAVLVLVTFGYRAWFIKTFDVLSADGTSYATMGKAFLQSWDPHVFGIIAPPLYSIFIGIFNLTLDDLELSARLVSVVFSTLTLIPVYLLARDAFGRTSAVMAAALLATLPFMHGMSAIDITEPTYTFFVMAAAYAFWRSVQTDKIWLGIAAGALFGTAYLARPESFIACFALSFFFVAMVFLRKSADRRTFCLLVTGLWCGFIIVSSPYIWYLHETTGVWQLSGKNGVNSEVIREYRSTISTTDQKFRLDQQGKFTEGKGQSLFKIMVDEPDLFWGNMVKNGRELFPALSTVFPVYLWPFLIIGIVAYPWRAGLLHMHLVLLGVLAPIVIYLLFFVQPRGFYAYIPGLLVWTAAGGEKIGGWLSAKLRRFHLVPVLAIALAAYYVVSELPQPRSPYDYRQDQGRYDDKQIGRRLKIVIPGDAPIMTRSGRIAFYAGKTMVIPPQATYPEIISFARNNKAGYLIATPQLLQMRPQLEFLFAPLFEPAKKFTPPPELEIVYMGQEPGGLPYLVYRILPIPVLAPEHKAYGPD